MKQFVELDYGGDRLRGMVHRPVSPASGVPAVIFYHGFTGNRIESHRLFFTLANDLEEAGLTAVRFDFLGSGESDGDYAKMTFPSLVDQATHIFKWVQAELKPSAVYVVGYSLGGFVTSILLEENDGVSRAVLVSPGRARRILERDKALYDRADDVLDVSGNRVGKGYYASLSAFLNRPSHFHPHQRILLIHGTADLATPISFGREYLEVQGGTKEFVEVLGADHGYSTLEWQSMLRTQIRSFLGVQS